MDDLKFDKTPRILGIYSKLINGYVVNKAEEAANYGVNDNTWSVNIRLKGGTVRGSIYGAAAYAGASGNRLFVMTGGTVNGWVAGGANGTQNDGGMMYGSSSLYIGGKTFINSNSSTSVINRAVGGNVFGAGCGYGSGSSSGQVTEGTTVVVADESYVERGVYGGGSYGQYGYRQPPKPRHHHDDCCVTY